MPRPLSYILLFIGFILSLFSQAKELVYYEGMTSIAKSVEYYQDESHSLKVEDVLNLNEFKAYSKKVLNFNVSQSNFWLRFSIENQNESEDLLLNLMQPRLKSVEFYELDDNGKVVASSFPTEIEHFDERNYKATSFVFDVNIPIGESRTYLIKINGNEQLTVPLYISDELTTLQFFSNKNLFSGMFVGVIVVMLLYNLFVYFSVKDRSYFYYVLYFILIGLTQMTIEGYTYKYLWPGSSFLETHSLAFLSSLAGIVLALFVQSILQTKSAAPGIHKVLNGIIVLFIITIGIQVFVSIQASFMIMQNIMLVGSLFTIYAAIVVYRRGQKSARFFLIAWSALIAGSVIFILKDFGVLPYNGFTKNVMQIASSLEAVLLSIALSDRINTYREEKMMAIQEKEAILLNQNVILEKQVKERTAELNEALVELKETQAQLVQSEKMSSLGQLTAGIAHEINNPMNYAKQSVVTIRRDMEDIRELLGLYNELSIDDSSGLKDKMEEIEDLKEDIEIDYLHQEIDEAIEDVEDGIKRAVEIAGELKTFSRMDEAMIKVADLEEGLNSTVELMKSEFASTKIQLEKTFGNIPQVECRASKLNQVFLNILNNAVHAIKDSDNRLTGLIRIETESVNEGKDVTISFEDNGKGMSEETRQKMFDPFYTTKDVGQGSGLGMSISYGIITDHSGKLEVESKLGVGTTIKITLPVKLELEDHEKGQG